MLRFLAVFVAALLMLPLMFAFRVWRRMRVAARPLVLMSRRFGHNNVGQSETCGHTGERAAGQKAQQRAAGFLLTSHESRQCIELLVLHDLYLLSLIRRLIAGPQPALLVCL
jgi:hypothetical protein